jgi:hypothetical protein
LPDCQIYSVLFCHICLFLLEKWFIYPRQILLVVLKKVVYFETPKTLMAPFHIRVDIEVMCYNIDQRFERNVDIR